VLSRGANPPGKTVPIRARGASVKANELPKEALK
jgi:hypothetical protein